MNKWNALLLLAALASGLVLITVRNQTRDYFSELNSAKQEMARMIEEYEFLHTRQAELSSTERVLNSAQQQGLVTPTLANTRMIRKQTNADSQ